MTSIARPLLLPVLGTLLALPAAALDFVTVGATNNPPDDETSCLSQSQQIFCRSNIGAVSYVFEISKYVTTNADYAEFLNAVAASDPNGLFNTNMETNGEISRLGSPGSYTYWVVGGRESYPARWVNYFRALRHANWLHNGKPTGAQDATTTEDGAYTLLGANPVDAVRNPGARYWLVNEDEFYKAAFYDWQIGWYYDYPTRTDDPPLGAPPPGGPNTANLCPMPFSMGGPGSCTDPLHNGPDEPTPVGAYVDSPSPWGTFDQGGQLHEYLEDSVPGEPDRFTLRGSAFHRGIHDASVLHRTNASKGIVGSFNGGYRLGREKPAGGRRCGLGFELALLLPLLRHLQRRRASDLSV